MQRTRKLIVVAAAIAALAAAGAGTAIAVSGDGGDDGDQATGAGADRARARAAALAITGGGTANAVERDSENGATWEVEVTRTDGKTVDVRLDDRFGLVVVEQDSERGDGAEQE
jgi:uncharacterized membrane protein YkoI